MAINSIKREEQLSLQPGRGSQLVKCVMLCFFISGSYDFDLVVIPGIPREPGLCVSFWTNLKRIKTWSLRSGAARPENLSQLKLT